MVLLGPTYKVYAPAALSFGSSSLGDGSRRATTNRVEKID